MVRHLGEITGIATMVNETYRFGTRPEEKNEWGAHASGPETWTGFHNEFGALENRNELHFGKCAGMNLMLKKYTSEVMFKQK